MNNIIRKLILRNLLKKKPKQHFNKKTGKIIREEKGSIN